MAKYGSQEEGFRRGKNVRDCQKLNKKWTSDRPTDINPKAGKIQADLQTSFLPSFWKCWRRGSRTCIFQVVYSCAVVVQSSFIHVKFEKFERGRNPSLHRQIGKFLTEVTPHLFCQETFKFRLKFWTLDIPSFWWLKNHHMMRIIIVLSGHVADNQAHVHWKINTIYSL